MSALGAAVVGLGIGEQHARTYAGLDTARLRWLYDLDQERMTRVIAAVGAGQSAPSFDAILRDRETDVLSIATFDDMHFGEVIAALEAGKHVFCEKPLCRSTAEVARIKDACRKSKRRLACNLVLRAAPLYVWLREAIRSGELGEVYAFDGDYLYGRLHKITEGWRKDIPDYSVMVGGGIHLVDLMMWVTGQRPTDVIGVGNRMATAGTAFRFNDFVAGTYRFESGMVGRITANFGCVHRHQHVVRVFGTKATLVYDDRGPRIHRARVDGTEGTPLPYAALPASKGDLIPSFLRDIADGTGEGVAEQHEFDVIAACVAADESVLRNQPIRIQYL